MWNRNVSFTFNESQSNQIFMIFHYLPALENVINLSFVSVRSSREFKKKPLTKIKKQFFNGNTTTISLNLLH